VPLVAVAVMPMDPGPVRPLSTQPEMRTLAPGISLGVEQMGAAGAGSATVDAGSAQQQPWHAGYM
jgi:hypothetical protein